MVLREICSAGSIFSGSHESPILLKKKFCVGASAVGIIAECLKKGCFIKTKMFLKFESVFLYFLKVTLCCCIAVVTWCCCAISSKKFKVYVLVHFV